METRFLIACCVFCFITGMFFAHMIEKDRGCTVEITRGQETHVFTGKP